MRSRVEFATFVARAGRPAAGRQLHGLERLAHSAGRQTDSFGYPSHVDGAIEGPEVPAGAERRIPAAVDHRAERVRYARSFARFLEGCVAGPRGFPGWKTCLRRRRIACDSVRIGVSRRWATYRRPRTGHRPGSAAPVGG